MGYCTVLRSSFITNKSNHSYLQLGQYNIPMYCNIPYNIKYKYNINIKIIEFYIA